MNVPLAVLTILLMIVLPPMLAILLRRRIPVPWWLFCLGMATFAGAQLIHLPLNGWLLDSNIVGPLSSYDSSFIVSAVILGLSAGFSETLARFVGYWLLFRRSGSAAGEGKPGGRWIDGVMVGLGHGGIESMGFVSVILAATLSSLWSLQGADLSALDLPAEQMAVISAQLSQLADSPLTLLVPLIERGLAIMLHVVLSMLVWLGFKNRKHWLSLLALLYHAAVDAAAVYLGQTVDSAWAIEGLLALMLLPGLLWLWRQRHNFASVGPASVRSWSTQLRLFAVATRKELLQMWRTKRVLVIVAIFAVFGLASPLLARFTPELLGSIEGAEQFADLIPEPTTADAMTQYLKNLTQFAFIIAILIGMGSIAGEREKGTSAMILSKPLPRWAFVVSKFSAQSLVFGGAFIIAALAAFYYTSILFDPLPFGGFMFANVLLWLWLMVFSAVTLVGSTAAASTGAAAGIAVLGSALLMILGSLPKVGLFMPSGLVAWAGVIGLGENNAPNGGAVAACAAIVVAALILSVAIFETKEI